MHKMHRSTSTRNRHYLEIFMFSVTRIFGLFLLLFYWTTLNVYIVLFWGWDCRDQAIVGRVYKVLLKMNFMGMLTTSMIFKERDWELASDNPSYFWTKNYFLPPEIVRETKEKSNKIWIQDEAGSLWDNPFSFPPS